MAMAQDGDPLPPRERKKLSVEELMRIEVTSIWLFKVDIRVTEGRPDLNNALNETADPQHRFMARSFVNLSRKFELDARLRFVDSFEYNDNGMSGTVPAYAEVDVRLVRIPTEALEVSMVGQNLLSEYHPEYVISDPNSKAEIERSVYLNVACRF